MNAKWFLRSDLLVGILAAFIVVVGVALAFLRFANARIAVAFVAIDLTGWGSLAGIVDVGGIGLVRLVALKELISQQG